MLPGSNRQSQAAIVSSIVKSSAALLKVLQDENASLEKGGVKDAKILLERKVACMNEYNATQEAFVEFARNNQINKEDANIKKVTDLMHKIQNENAKNEQLLRLNIEISENIVATYKEAQAKRAASQSGYNSQGKANKSVERGNATPESSWNNKV